MKPHHVIAVLALFTQGCLAGWLNTPRGPLVVVGSDNTTGRLAAVEASVASLTAQITVAGPIQPWARTGPVGDFMGSAVSSNGARQVRVQNGSIEISSDYGASLTLVAGSTTNQWCGIAASGDGLTQIVPQYVDEGGGYAFTTNFWASWAFKTNECNIAALNYSGQIILKADEIGYVYLSTNNGATFTPCISDGERAWTALAMSHDGVYMTAVAQPEDEKTSGLFVSSDSGATWTHSMENPTWTAVSVGADGKRQLACASWGRIYVSDNYGSSWNTVPGPLMRWDQVAVCGNGTWMYAAANYGTLYASSDYGLTWNTVSSGSPHDWTGLALSYDAAWGLAASRNTPTAQGCLVTLPSTTVRGSLTTAGAIAFNQGQLSVRGTQLVFIVNGITNVLDSNLGAP